MKEDENKKKEGSDCGGMFVVFGLIGGGISTFGAALAGKEGLIIIFIASFIVCGLFTTLLCNLAE